MKPAFAAILAAVCLLFAHSASAQPPGAPVGGCAVTSIDTLEGPTDAFPDEHIGAVPLPCPVFSGYVVLLESSTAALTDLRNWSDVVAFTTAGPAQPGAPTDHYVVEGLDPAAPDINLYPANGPAGPIVYRIHSDPPEPPTPAANASWGQLKVHYR